MNSSKSNQCRKLNITIHLLNTHSRRHRPPFSAVCTTSLSRCPACFESTVISTVIRHVNIHIQVRELLILVPFISVALRSGTFRRSSQAQFGQFGLLLLQTLLSPLDASVLEPDFDLRTDNTQIRNPAVRLVAKYFSEVAVLSPPFSFLAPIFSPELL